MHSEGVEKLLGASVMPSSSRSCIIFTLCPEVSRWEQPLEHNDLWALGSYGTAGTCRQDLPQPAPRSFRACGRLARRMNHMYAREDNSLQQERSLQIWSELPYL